MAYKGLFPPPSIDLIRELEGFGRLLDEVQPLRPKHRSALAGKIRALSTFLTVDREQLPPDYMNQPPLLSAYLHYFLPWNLYRQGRLLAGLDLHLKPGARIVDLGAGPLTFLLALWLSRPHLREQELDYLGLDRSENVLKMGRRIFKSLSGTSRWRVRTERKLIGAGRQPKADVLVMANFLNELDSGSEHRKRSREADEEELSPHELLLARWESQVEASAAILLIEPGMRAAGRNLVRLREAALARGWQVAAPCPHAGTCPMPGQRHTAWCHFNFPSVGVPFWLEKLSRRAKLPKERASLSFLLLTRGEEPPLRVQAPGLVKESEGLVRVVSESFDLPDWQRGRYGCSDRGLVVLQDKKDEPSEGPRPGDMLRVTWPDEPRRDRKSGAWILPRSR